MISDEEVMHYAAIEPAVFDSYRHKGCNYMPRKKDGGAWFCNYCGSSGVVAS